MKKRVLFLLVLLILLCVCAVAGAEFGWTKEGDYLYYYKDDAKLTGTQVIDGHVYNFTSTGELKGEDAIIKVGSLYYYITKENKLKTGWLTIEGFKYYFLPDEGYAVTETTDYNKRVEIDGVKNYLFNKEGQLVINAFFDRHYGDKDGRWLTGYQTIDDLHYYFSENGTAESGLRMLNGKILGFFSSSEGGSCQSYGWVVFTKGWSTQGKVYYFDPETGVMQVGSKEIDGVEYTFKDDGTLVIESPIVIKRDDDQIYGYSKDLEQLYSWQEIDGNTYYFSNGLAYTGYRVIPDYSSSLDRDPTYYFSDDGVLQKEIFYTEESGRKHYFGADGKEVSGWQNIEGETYYFGDEEYRDPPYARTGVLRTGVDPDGEKGGLYYYLFDSEGRLQRNVFSTDDQNRLYYYGDNGYRLTGWQEIDGYWYYFKPDEISIVIGNIGNLSQMGEACKGGWYEINEESGKKKYFFDKDGKLTDFHTGWILISGKWFYYVDDLNYAIGWQLFDDTWYFFNTDGEMVTGWLDGGGTWYYFLPSGAMMTGWMQDGATWYYFDDSGVMVTGTQVIDGAEYNFDSSGAWVENAAPAQTGWVENGGAWYYYSDSGTMTVGWMADGGTWYYFNDSGAMATGWVKDGGTWYYFNASGAMVTGWKSIGGSWYYFKSSGEMKTGWLELGGTWYWFDNGGTMATGWKEINGQWEMFADSGAWLYTWDGN